MHTTALAIDLVAILTEKATNKLMCWIRNTFDTFAPIKLPPFGLAIYTDAS